MIHKSVEGYKYDDSEPLNLTVSGGKLVWNRSVGGWKSWASLNARAIAASWTWANREVGIPSLLWRYTHRNFNFQWGPGLDDTSGLASEAVTNGEAFTGATGSTPPTGWTDTGLAPRFTLDTGVLTMDATGAGAYSLEQDVTVTPGTVYVLEVGFGDGSSSGATITLQGVTLPIPTMKTDWAASFKAEGSTVKILFDYDATEQIVVDYVRIYEEAELTGSGGAEATAMAMARVMEAPVKKVKKVKKKDIEEEPVVEEEPDEE